MRRFLLLIATISVVLLPQSSWAATVRAKPAPSNIAQAQTDDAIALYDRALPTTVSIVLRPKAERTATNGKVTFKLDSGAASGFFLTSDGLIATSKHVVSDDANAFAVITSDDDEYPAVVVAVDPLYDLALIKIEVKDFPTLKLADGAPLVGQTVYAIGNAAGEFPSSLVHGLISGLHRSLEAADSQGKLVTLDDLIQTDAPINQGNSGGPLLDARGQALGVVTAIREGSRGISFATPVLALRQAFDSYRKSGKIIRPFLGLRYLTITKRMARQRSLAVNYGALVTTEPSSGLPAVVPGTPADRAGLIDGDIILSIEGQKLTGQTPLISRIQGYAPGQAIILEILRYGVQQPVLVTLGEKVAE